MATLINLLQNAALLALGVLAYSLARPRMARWPGIAQAVCGGALFGVLALLSMMTPLHTAAGFRLDARAIMVALATVFSGPLAGVMAALPPSVYRMGGPGPGAMSSHVALAATVLLAWGLRGWLARRRRDVGISALALLGVAISLTLVVTLYIFIDPAPRDAMLREAMLPFALSIIIGLPGLGMLIMLGDRERDLRRAIASRDEMLRHSQQAVVGILKDEFLAGRGLERQLATIAKTGASVLGVELVTIWRYDETLPVARCLERWDGRPPHRGPVPRGSVPDTHYDKLPDMRAALTRDLSYRAVHARTDPVAGPLIDGAYPGNEPMSMLYSGVRHADRLVGHLAFGTVGRLRHWTLEEETFARSLADLVGLALLQDQLDRKEATTRRNLDLLFRLVRDELLRGAPLDETLRAITEMIGATLDIERTSIWRLDEPAGVYRCLDLWERQTGRHVGDTLPVATIGIDVTGILRRDYALIIDDIAQDPRLAPSHRAFLQSIGLKSAMLVQIGLPTQPFGALVFSSTEGRVWTIEDQTVARSLADLISLAVLKDELDRREQALRRNQALVLKIVRDELLRTAPAGDILRSIAETIGRALEVDRVSVWRVEEARDEVQCVGRWMRHDAAQRGGETASLKPYLALYSQLRHDIVIDVEDAATDPRIPTGPVTLSVDFPRSLLMALIGTPDRPIGVLAFGDETTRAWSLEDHTLIRSLSQLIAFAFLSQSYREAIAALDLVGEGITVQGPTSEIIYANRTARDLGLVEGTQPGPVRAIPGAIDTPDGVSEVAWTTPGGQRRDLAISRRQLPDGGVVTMLSDVTDQKDRQRQHEQLEEQLRQSTKMEAVGRLAGGIAHDFNNMIGAILGFATFLSEDLADGSAQQTYARRITEVCTRSREVVKQLLTFSRPGDVDRRVIDLRDAVSDNAALLRAALPSAIDFKIEPCREPLPVLVNVGQIYQVLLNLCGNANDAIEGDGRITVRLARIDPGDREHRLFEGGPRALNTATAIGSRLDPDRPYAVMRIVDSGVGMDQVTLDRVFEPFFTTKPRGRGTGLGLAVVHGVVNGYHGSYLVQSRVGVGTEFAIYLPLMLGDARGSAVAATGGSTHGGESVLIVDDDVDLADMLSIALERLGYDVTCCNDPLEALDAFEQDPGAWDVVISDHMMPGLKGLELIERLKALRPDCVAVLCTGFADDVSEARALAAGADLFVLKPAAPRRIAERVRELLDRRVEVAVPSA